MPNEGLVLIGGTDRRFADIPILGEVIGNLIVGESPHDGVVPLRSAFARDSTGSSISLVKALEAARFDEDFSHRHGGSDRQPIEPWAREDVIDHLTDWGTGQFTDAGGFPLQCPTPTAEGFVSSTVAFDWNMPHQSLTGIGVVVYVFDGQHEWRIASGADPESGALEDFRSLEGSNSIDGFEPGGFTVTTTKPLPKLELDTPDPSTRIIDAVSVFFPLGPGARFTDRVPTDPTELRGFTPPDLDHPRCPCSEPSNPTCH